MNGIREYFRVREWYDSKIPLAMAIFLHGSLQGGAGWTNREFALTCLVFFLYFLTYFAFHYLINDFFDREADRLAGKKKVILSVPGPVVAASLAALFLAGNLPLWCLAGFRPQVIGVSLAAYLLGVSYSVKGLRMKERGIWGLIVSSFAQRNSPVLLLAVLMPLDSRVFWCWMVISFVNGLRYILIHQYIDRENDRKANIHTFVGDHMKSIGAAIWAALLTELAALAVLFSDLRTQPLLWLFLAAYLVLFFLNRNFVEEVLHQSFFYSFVNVPLEDLYNVYLPLILAVCCVRERGLYLLGAAVVLYLWIPLKKKWGMPVMAVRKAAERSGRKKAGQP